MSKSTHEKARKKVFNDWLYKKYPAVFQEKPIPLVIGISQELLQQLPDDITPSEFNIAMRWYCQRMTYHKSRHSAPSHSELEYIKTYLLPSSFSKLKC